MKICARGQAAARGLVLGLTSMVASTILMCVVATAGGLLSVGVGLLLFPPAVVGMRRYASTRRRLTERWFGIRVAEAYLPIPPHRGGLADAARRCWALKSDRGTWRDLLWLCVDSTVGCFLALVPATLILEGVFGWVLAAGVWRPISTHGGNEWYTFIHVTTQTRADLAAVEGIGMFVIGWWIAPAVMGAHARLTRRLLAPSERQELALRVRHLTETRSEAVDASAAELRRIERDLHDGAQARMVAVGMNLGAIERLLDEDPDKARLLLAETRQSSAQALGELRDLVRGIHPPVLAERGLGDAVRALALRMPTPTHVQVEALGRLDAPVESAAYFAVSEILTNAVKHSGARQMWIDMRHERGMLCITVTDDGHGGARIAPSGEADGGTGLAGIERRLGAFDGVLALTSPAGGPTIVSVELPCASSSPKTSSS